MAAGVFREYWYRFKPFIPKIEREIIMGIGNKEQIGWLQQ
jgi:hypothetical protein